MYDNIKQLRLLHEKTQEQMADIVGCSTNAYIQKEKNRTAFNVEEIKIIKAFFNLTIEQTWKIFFTD